MGDFPMKKSKFTMLILAALAVLTFSFQNCGSPVVNRQARSSSGPTFEYEADTSPGIDRTDGGTTAMPFAPGADLYASSKYGATDFDEWAYSLYPTSDGGYISTGRRRVDTQGSWDVLIQKWNSLGELDYSVNVGDQWTNEGARAIELPDSYLIVGSTRSQLDDENFNRRADVLLLKVNKGNGDIIDAQRLGDPNISIALNDVILVDANSNPYLIAVGVYVTYTNNQPNRSQAFMMRFDPFLTVTWQQSFSATNRRLNLNAVTYRPGSGFYAVGGWENNAGEINSLIMRFSVSGVVTRASYLNDSVAGHDELFAIENSGYDLVAVGKHDGHNGGDGLIVRFDYSTNPTEAHLLGNANRLERLNGVKTTFDGGLLLSGDSDSINAGDMDNWITKLDAQYEVDWAKMFGTNSDDFNDYQPIVVRSDGGYAFLTNDHNNSISGTYNPRLLLLDQFGRIPSGCTSSKGDAPVTRSGLSPITFQTFTTSATTTSLVIDAILDDSEDYEELAVTINQFCTI